MLSRRKAIAAFAALALCSGSRVVRAQAVPESDCATIYVIDHGWHTAIVMPARDFEPKGFFRETTFNDRRWLELGWGDATYYETPGAGVWLGLRALFTPTDTVMQVIGFDEPAAKTFPGLEIVKLRVSPSGYRTIIEYIKGSFARDTDGRPVLSMHGRDGRSSFYKAPGVYHVFRTCNTWLAEVLIKGGLPLDPHDAVRAGDIMAQLRALRWNGGCKAIREVEEENTNAE